MEENKEKEEETKVETPKKKKSGLFTIFACIMTGIIVFLAMNIGNMIDDIINPEHYNVGTGSSDNNKDLTIDLDVSQGAREDASYTVTPEGIVTVEERHAGNCREGAEGCYLRPVYYVKGVKAGTAQVTVTVFDFSTKEIKRQAVYQITVDENLKITEKHLIENGLIVEFKNMSSARQTAEVTVGDESVVSVKAEVLKVDNLCKGCEDTHLYVIKGLKEGTTDVTFTRVDTETKEIKYQEKYNIKVGAGLHISETHTEVAPTNVQPNQQVYDKAKSGVVLEYTISKVSGTQEEVANYSYIKVYADNKIEWGKAKSNDKRTKILTAEQGNEIYNIAFDKSFKDLGTNLSDNTVTDGNSVYVTLYYADGTSFKTGGLNPTNEKFKSLTSKLDSFTQDGVSE